MAGTTPDPRLNMGYWIRATLPAYGFSTETVFPAGDLYNDDLLWLVLAESFRQYITWMQETGHANEWMEGLGTESEIQAAAIIWFIYLRDAMESFADWSELVQLDTDARSY